MTGKQKSPYETLAALVTVLGIIYWLTDLRPFLITGLVLGLAGSLFKQAAYYINLVWMWIAKGLNMIVSNLLLGIIFFLVLSPIAFFYRLANRKQLMTHKNDDTFYAEIDREVQPKDLIHPW